MNSSTKQDNALSRTLFENARHWWETLRPVAWTFRQHMDNPTINTTSPAEAALARTVVAAIEAGLC